MPYAIIADRADGHEFLNYREFQRPVPQPGQLLISVAAAGVNFEDAFRRNGSSGATYPYVPGSEASGTVVEMGTEVQGFALGDRIATAEGDRCYAEYALVDAAKALPVPDQIDDFTAAALPCQGLTAHYLANSAFAAVEGHTVLVHTDGDATGLLLIQLLKAKGVVVLTAVPTDQKEALALQAGADHTLRWPHVSTAVRDLTQGRGVDVVYDSVGKEAFTESIESLAIRGSLISFGHSSGPAPSLDLQGSLAGKSITVTQPSLGAYLRNPAERRWRSSEIFTAAAGNSLKVLASIQYRLSDAGQAHRELESGELVGKGILVP